MHYSRVIYFFAMIFLLACGDSKQGNPLPQMLTFKTERDFKNALKGTWVIKGYRDSIEKGITPINIPTLLENESITYDPEFQYHNFNVRYDSAKNNATLIYTDKEYSDSSFRTDTTIKNVTMSLSGSDTILLVTSNSNEGISRKEFVRVPEYRTLVRQKFISGKYYVAGKQDTSQTISFTEDGRVINAQLIGEKKAINYHVGVYKQTNIKADHLYFTHPDVMLAFVYYWRKNNDTLFLESPSNSHPRQYKLIKKQTF